jgi:DNA-binding NarL/FixJ family response regulator
VDADVRGERSGTEMLVELHRQNPDVAILVTTSRLDEPMIATVNALGSAAIIPKPYLRTELLDRVQALMCKRTTR